ncbi:MAG: plasmid pRiA4b ORF-3 family protein [Treponema sp.]|nr:plasmid pRiA4b ORF-3 family protein [Treponema sp.]
MSQEEIIYDFLDAAAGTFDLADLVSYMRKIEPARFNQLAAEAAAFIDFRNLAFPIGKHRWMSRRGFFEPISFVISPSRLELLNGIFIPGHRCVPFANPGLLPQEYTFFWQGSQIPFTATEGSPEEFYPFYNIFGEEYAPQYVARDNAENEAAFNSDPYSDPPEVSIKTLDMRNIYREASFVPGDRFTVETIDWNKGFFKLAKTGKDEWDSAELDEWLRAAEYGFEASFNNLGPASSTEEQLAYAYWHGPPRMREIPAYALEEFLYQKTEKIETSAYGIETRFWHTGQEISDKKELDGGNVHPDKTPVEKIFEDLNIPISEFVIQSYVRDSLYRGDLDASLIMARLIPAAIDLDSRSRKVIMFYIEGVMDEFRDSYSRFADNSMGSIRLRMGELHTAVIELVAKLRKGNVDLSWLPRHTFIILSQIQNHAAYALEDLNCSMAPPQAELEAMDGSLDSMLETYEDMKELIDEAKDSFRRNRLTVIRPGNNSGAVSERLIQLSIGGIDVWRRVIVNEDCTLEELHHIIQAVFGWRNTQEFKFSVGNSHERGNKSEKILSLNRPAGGAAGSGEADLKTRIKDIEAIGLSEARYEYGANWNARVMILSRHEAPADKPVRCIAGSGSAPPESINGPIKFKRAVSALENGNDMARLTAQQELGTDFFYEEFDLDACNRNLNAIPAIKR